MNYKILAEMYDILTYDVNYGKMGEFYKKIFRKKDIYVRDILELGCGTGNITERLVEYNVFGIDNSEDMLTLASEKFYNRRNVSLFKMDIREFSFNNSFDACIAALDVINYITDVQDLKEVFLNVFNHLKDDSIFIFDVNSSFKIREFIGNNVFTDEVDDILYVWQGSYDENTQINDSTLTFFIRDQDGRYERYSEVHREKAYELEFLKGLLLDIGFDNIESYNDFELNEVNEDSLRISIVAHKKGK